MRMIRKMLVLPILSRATAGEALPYIVVITSDDQPWTDYAFRAHRFTSHPHIKTTDIERFAAGARGIKLS